MPLLEMQRLRLFERFVRATGRLARGKGPPHLDVGLRGEEAAYFHLRRSGYIVVARGWRSAKLRGDIDLIAWQHGTLCFVEVKTRTSRTFAPAETAVDEEKRKILRRMARHYLRGLDPVHGKARLENVRFDVLAVYLRDKGIPEFEHFPGAFGFL